MKTFQTLKGIGLVFTALAISLMSLTSGLTPGKAAQAPDLSAAQKALFDGDYDNAATLFTAALEDAKLKCSAEYGLGITKLRALHYADADAAFTHALTECPATFQSYALRGDVRRAVSRNSDALADYEQALTLKPGLIDSYLYERIASVSPEQAIGYLIKAAAAPRPLSGQVALDQRLVAVYRAFNDIPELEQEYTALLNVATTPDVIAQAEEALGELQIDHNEAAKGYAHLQNVIATYPASQGAFDALLTLVTDGQDVDLLTRSRINILNANYRPVINKLVVYLLSNGSDKDAPELYVLLGKAQRGTAQYAEAIASFQKVRDAYSKDPLASTAALQQGITYQAENDEANALKAYNEVVTAYPTSAEAPQALWDAAQLEASAGHNDQAIASYEQLAKSYPGTGLAQTGLFQEGLLLSTSDPARAADAFGRYASTQGLLWQGKMLQAANGDAQTALTKAAAQEPGTFFSLRANDLLTKTAPFSPPAKLNLPGAASSDADSAAAVNWVKAQFKLTSVSTTLPPALAQDQGLARGVALWDLGWWPEAAAEFDTVYSLHSNDAAALFALAVYYKTLGVYRSSIQAASRIYVLSGVPIADVPRYIAQMVYPIYYPDLLVSSAQAEHLDPLFVATIIRTESRFDPHASGGAGDTGLMQMIPVTGYLVAADLKVTDFQPSDLYRPMISLQFGSHYLHSLQAALSGNLAPTVVGYNAGIDYTTRLWLSANGDVDRFYQQIDVESIQGYLSYAYEQYAAYSQVYG